MRVTLDEVWVDDHILCCTVTVDGETTKLWWCGWEGPAAACYADRCPEAAEDLKRMITETKEQEAEDDGTN